MIRLTRLVLPGAATALALAASLGPMTEGRRELRDLLIVVDITRSMNVRDMGGQSRLDASKAMLSRWIARQPCGTRIGLGFFTERRSLTLLEPVEICTDYAALTGSLQALDWRMAWEGDSMISKGLDHALARAAALDTGLVFVSDGQEAPPLPYSGAERWQGDSPGGVILGVGGDTPAPIPKFDDLGREAGFYEAGDVQSAPSRVGPPPEDAASRPGYHPRNNPYGESDLEGNEHLSALRADYLTQLAGPRQLGFLRLGEGPAALDRAVVAHVPARLAAAPRPLGPVLGGLSLLFFAAAWLCGLRLRPARLTEREIWR